jgi:ABC-type nitrate/sulfonate/bicarbonate transport system substrate-binding protein
VVPLPKIAASFLLTLWASKLSGPPLCPQRDGSRSLAELKGKSVGITFLGSPGHLFLAAIAAHVGIDPGKDLHWVTTDQAAGPIELFTGGKVDALSFHPTRSSCAASTWAE